MSTRDLYETKIMDVGEFGELWLFVSGRGYPNVGIFDKRSRRDCRKNPMTFTCWMPLRNHSNEEFQDDDKYEIMLKLIGRWLWIERGLPSLEDALNKAYEAIGQERLPEARETYRFSYLDL